MISTGGFVRKTACKNWFSQAVLLLGKPICFHRRSLIKTACKNYVPPLALSTSVLVQAALTMPWKNGCMSHGSLTRHVVIVTYSRTARPAAVPMLSRQVWTNDWMVQQLVWCMTGEWQWQKTCASNEKETHSGRGVAGVCPPGRLHLLAKHSHDSCLHY